MTSFVYVPYLRCNETARSVVRRHRPGPEGGVELIPVDHLRLKLQVNDEVLARLTRSVPAPIQIGIFVSR